VVRRRQGWHSPPGVKAIDLDARNCEIVGNRIAEYGVPAAGGMAAVLAMGIDLSGTDTGGNIVTGNLLGGTYNETLYQHATSGDEWGGNFGSLTGGVTAAIPTT
jgi:hypothetical protein